MGHTAAAAGQGSWAGWRSPVGRLQVAAMTRAPQVQQTGGVGLGSPGDLREVARGGGSQVEAALARAGGVRLFSRPGLLVEVGAAVGDVKAVTPDMPPLPLPRLVLAQGLQLRFDLAMMVHILADLQVLEGSFPLGPRVPVPPVALQFPHQAADDGQAGLPGPGHGAWSWL